MYTNCGFSLNSSAIQNGVVYLDQNGETATESISDDETAEHMLNFVFVGANIVTGKSSIRTKPSAKKVGFIFFYIRVNGKLLESI